MHDFDQLLRQQRTRQMPITILMDDCDGTASVITVDPAAFTMPKRQIFQELRYVVKDWMERYAAA